MDSNIQQTNYQNLPVGKTSSPNYFLLITTIIVVSVITGLTGYFIANTNDESVVDNDITSTDTDLDSPESQDICNTDKSAIYTLINIFETLQIQRDAIGVLSLFTPAQLDSDIEDYQNLNGENPDIGQPRLYNSVSFNYNTASYEIISLPVLTPPNTCDIQVSEQRSYYGGPVNPQYLEPEDMTFSFTVIKENDIWLIDRYESLDTNIQEGKYSGFIMNISN